MILIIHGENSAQSRKYYADIKQSTKNPVTLEGTSITLTDLAQTLQGQGLFDEQKYIFIEEFFSKRKQSKELEGILNYLSQHHADHTITIWESKSLTPAQLKAVKNAQVQKFDFPKILFNFLDAIKPENNKQAIQLFHETIKIEEAEFVFFMIVRHIRMLLALSDQSEIPIDEIKRLAPWQKGKLQKQMEAFGQEKLIEIYNALFEIESGMKTGRLPLPIIPMIDFLLINL